MGSKFKISGIVFVYGAVFGLTSGAALLYSSMYAPSEQEKKEAASKYYSNNPQSAAKKKEFEAFFAKMKQANDPNQQKVCRYRLSVDVCLSMHKVTTIHVYKHS